MDKLILNGQALTLAEIEAVALAGCRVEVAGDALRRVKESRVLIENILAAGETVYGVNTGFGKLADVRIPGGQACRAADQPGAQPRGRSGRAAGRSGGAGHAAVARQRAGEGLQRRARGTAGVAGRLAECRRAPGDSGEGIGGRKRRSGSTGASRSGGCGRGRSVLSRRADCRRGGAAPCRA